MSQASLRIIAHEDARLLMARNHVDDSLLASLGGGVRVAVCGRDSNCLCLLTRIRLLRTIVVN